MSQNTNVTQHIDGVAGLKKQKMSPISIAFFIYCLTAAGAFGIEAMIPSCGPGMTILMLIVIPVVWAIPICMSVSELSAFMPEENGLYVWVKEAFGEMWGFFVGWWATLSIYLGMASYVVLVVGYASKFLPISATGAMCIKIGMILLFTVINLLGTKEVALLDTIFSVLILGSFGLVTVVGFANWDYNPIEPFIAPETSVFGCIGSAICIGIWMYCGYGCISSMAGEIENPEAIPKGFKIAIPIIMLSYILPTVAGLVSMGSWESWGVDGENAVDYASVLTTHLGPVWGVVFLIIAIVGQCAIFNSYILAGSRSFFVLGNDKLCPHFLTKLSKKRRVPYWPILILAAITMLLMNLDFSVILTIICPLGIICYVVLAFAFVKLRKKYPIEERGDVYHVKGGVPAVVFMVICPVVVGIFGLYVNGTEYFLLGFISIVTAVIFYIAFKWIYGGLYKIDPIKYPINEKTRLAKGDITRIGIFFFLFGIILFVGAFFLAWYEGEWGPDYYLDLYGSGVMSDFWGMIKIGKIGGGAMIIAGAVMYLIGKKKDPVPKNN